MKGEIGKLRREQQPLLKSCPEAQKIGFPNVIMPGEVRNDLYLTIGTSNFCLLLSSI